MRHPTLGIDHCFALVHDLDTAADQYRRLGFTLSPRGEHSAEKGSANYTIMFPHDYFELLGLVAQTPLNAPRARMLDTQGEGLHAIACRIEDATKGAKELDALGIGAEKLGSFERPVPLPGGGTARAAFTTLSYSPSEVPQGIVFMCQHHTPDAVWLPELMSHANGAQGLAAIVALSDEPQDEAVRFARLWAGGRVHEDATETRIATGVADTPPSADLVLMNRMQMARSYPDLDLTKTARGAFTVARFFCASLDDTAAFLREAGFIPIKTAKGIAVPAEYASGVVVEFTAKG